MERTTLINLLNGDHSTTSTLLHSKLQIYILNTQTWVSWLVGKSWHVWDSCLCASIFNMLTKVIAKMLCLRVNVTPAGTRHCRAQWKCLYNVGADFMDGWIQSPVLWSAARNTGKVMVMCDHNCSMHVCIECFIGCCSQCASQVIIFTKNQLVSQDDTPNIKFHNDIKKYIQSCYFLNVICYTCWQ